MSRPRIHATISARHALSGSLRRNADARRGIAPDPQRRRAVRDRAGRLERADVGQPVPDARIPRPRCTGPAARRRAPDGRSATSPPGTTAGSSARCRCTRRRTATASTSSTGDGPRHTAVTAAATIRSSCAAVPFTPVAGPRLLAAQRRSAAPCSRTRSISCARHAYSTLHVLFLPGDRSARGRGVRHDPARGHAVPLDEPRLSRLRRLSRRRSRTTSARR